MSRVLYPVHSGLERQVTSYLWSNNTSLLAVWKATGNSKWKPKSKGKLLDAEAGVAGEFTAKDPP